MGPLQYDIPSREADGVYIQIWTTPQYPHVRTFIRPAQGGAAIFDRWDYVPPQGQMPVTGRFGPLSPGRYTVNVMYSSNGAVSGSPGFVGARDFIMTGQPGPGDGLGGGPAPPPGSGGSVRIGGNFAGQKATPYVWFNGGWRPSAAYVYWGGWKRGN